MLFNHFISKFSDFFYHNDKIGVQYDDQVILKTTLFDSKWVAWGPVR